jgi:hypothetical protein
MRSLPSISPRQAAFLYIALVFTVWIIALLPGPLSSISQTWPIIVALPWSLIFLQNGFFSGSLWLFLTFLAGILNAGVLYVALRGWRRLTQRRRQLLLPPAA